jgi:hypothetical protein
MPLIIENTMVVSPTGKRSLQRQRKKRPGHLGWDTTVYTLIGTTDYMAINVITWGLLQKLGERFGWKPAGTKSPAGVDDWGGNYIGKDGQLVTSKDATALASALAKALDNIPQQEAMGGKATSKGGIKSIADVNPIQHFGGRERKKALRDFITFCKMGGFTIN